MSDKLGIAETEKTMIRIQQIKLAAYCEDEQAALLKKAAKQLRTGPSAIQSLSIVKKSLDARKKPEIYAVYTVDVKVSDERAVFRKSGERAGRYSWWRRSRIGFRHRRLCKNQRPLTDR